MYLLLTGTRCVSLLYLVAAEAVHHGHTDEVEQHTQALERDDRETEDAVLLRQTRRIVPTEHAAVLARQTASRCVRGFGPDMTISLRF